MRSRRFATIALIAVLATASTACARFFRSYDIAPNGLTRTEDGLRVMLASGRADTALLRLEDRGPEDDVLRALYSGIIAYYAGAYEESGHLFDGAAALAEDRVTKSVSRSVFSLVSNDRVLPYEPSPTERLLIPYYGALSFLRLGQLEGAAVEARRLSTLLQRFEDEGTAIEAGLHAGLRYFAGAVFEAAGAHADADVAYRNAATLGMPLPTRTAGSAAAGAALVVVEQGFVAHRVEQSLNVYLLPEEIDRLDDDEDEQRSPTAAGVAARVVAAALHEANDPYARGRTRTLRVGPPQRTGPSPAERRAACEKHSLQPAEAAADTARARVAAAARARCLRDAEDDVPYLLRLAWPTYRAERPSATPLLLRSGTDNVSFLRRGDVSAGVMHDFEQERTLVLARMIVRGVAKAALTRSAERKVEENNEGAGKLIGLIGNIGNVLLERADTRSWHLLPGGIAMARIDDLPAGTQTLTIEGGHTSEPVEVPVTVARGRLTIVPVRLW